MVLAAVFFACTKSNDARDQISLSASTTQAMVGQTVSVTVSSNVNATQWTVTPSTVSKAFVITTNKTNYFNFSEAGVYTVSVSAKSVDYDSTAHQSLDSCWNHTSHGHCVKGIDSASIKIIVTK